MRRRAGTVNRFGAFLPLLVPAGTAAWLHRRGFTTVRELRAGQQATVAELAVGAVEARHDGRRLGGPRAEALGDIVRNRRVIYFAGDTELFAEMSRLRVSPSVLDRAAERFVERIAGPHGLDFEMIDLSDVIILP